jgi:hypothetical protein
VSGYLGLESKLIDFLQYSDPRFGIAFYLLSSHISDHTNVLPQMQLFRIAFFVITAHKYLLEYIVILKYIAVCYQIFTSFLFFEILQVPSQPSVSLSLSTTRFVD